MPSKVNLALAIANALGVTAYLYLVSHNGVWYIPEERAAGIYSVTAEPFIWALIVFPIWAVFGLIDLIWAVTIIVKKRRRNAHLWLAVVCMWLVAVVIDYAHH